MNWIQGYHIVLASGSPRRRELMTGLDLPFEVISMDFDEDDFMYHQVEEVAEVLSRHKSDHIPDEILKENIIVITADTVVLSGKRILGKPRNREEAIEMLQLLSGREHRVTTGVCFRNVNRMYSFSETTRVKFKAIADEEIIYYIDEYQPYDKAGAYGIQEWIGKVAVEKIIGSYWNVMGLPVQRLYHELKLFVEK